MNLDFYLNDKLRFNARCSAIIYSNDKSKILIFKMDGNDYYMLPGGRIEFNESSIDAIKREVLEEIGLNLDFNLISIQENFVKKREIQIMQYAFCFEAINNKMIDKLEFKCLDNDTQKFYWVNISELESYNIVPVSSFKLIKRAQNKIVHLIERG